MDEKERNGDRIKTKSRIYYHGQAWWYRSMSPDTQRAKVASKAFLDYNLSSKSAWTT